MGSDFHRCFYSWRIAAKFGGRIVEASGRLAILALLSMAQLFLQMCRCWF
jgi:hypothetical protein